MGKISIAIRLIICMAVLRTIAGNHRGTLCLQHDCRCCATNARCDAQTNFHCEDGCSDGIWGNKCFNRCPHNCNTCTQSSGDGGRPCTSCTTGNYGENCDQSCSVGCVGGTCNIDGSCTCIAGYYRNTCDQSCSAGCVGGTCNIDGSCTCIAGYYRNTCDHSCAVGCVGGTCNIDGSCTCITGYYRNTCDQSCSAGCVGGTCNIDGSCSCRSGYSGDKCDTVVVCPDNCLTCTSSTNCQTCKIGYFNGYKNGNWLNNCDHSCRSNCRSCSSLDACIDCVDTYWGQTCDQTCPGGCSSISCYKNTGNCYDCKQGFMGNKCDQCVAGKYGNDCTLDCSSTHCKTNVCMKDSGWCSACINGYYGDNKCDKMCSTSCKYASNECDFNSGACTYGCDSGYSGDKCCLNNNNCKTCSSHTHCSVCKVGYSGDKCCINNDRCVSCSSNQACSLCTTGYSGDKCCVNNNNCVTCSDRETCSQCVEGFSGDKCCLQNNNCETCSSSTECSICIPGWYGSTCVDSCSIICKDSLCNMDGSCIACSEGYYGSLCQSKCPGQCITCFSLNNCTTCTSGLFGPLCNEACPENCVDCTSLNTCQACKPGFKGPHCQDECINCKPGTKCNQIGGRCDTCIDGKYRDDCMSNCHSNCLSCERNSHSKCTECTAGKYGYSTYPHCFYDCLPNNCLNSKCDSTTGFCKECQMGFKGTYCMCPINCQTCDAFGQCKTCITGYSNSNKQCECRNDKCSPSGCEQCNDLTWYSDSNSQSCCQCSSNCKSGQCVTDTECASGCEDGYYGNACDKLCSARDNNCLQCITLNNNYNGCSKCSQGHYPGTNFCQACNSNCQTSNCDQRTGKCLDGCEKRFTGDTCESSCPINCLMCNQATGDCEVCENGKYTTDCSVSCSANCKILEGEGLRCRINDGACLDGCISTKLYGIQCSEDCSLNCKDENCDWQTGNCLTCIADKYGATCGEECSSNCVTNAQGSQSTRCYGENGTCTAGCISGFHGFKCEDSCSQYCSNTTCGRHNGECLHGCMEGYIGGTCTQALASGEPPTKSGPGAAIGGAVGGVVVVALIVIGVLFLVRRRRSNKATYASSYANNETPNNSKKMPDSAHIYDNTTETVNLYPAETREKINSVIKPVSNPNYNKPPVKPKPKLEDIRKSVKPEEPPEIDIDDVDNDVETGIPSTTATEGNYGYYNVAGMKRGIPVAKLAEHVAKRDKDDFEQEFKEFGNGLVRPYLDSQKPQNRARNRYQQIYPYDEHRVHLQGSSTDYINASHIDGYQHPKEYIACLGPTEKASEKFEIVWMMIWEQKVEKIAMVTNLFENGAMKCEQYWPDVTTSLKYGDVTVTCHSEDEYADYTLRSFTVSKDSENRSLHHIHYTAWPDKGVPDNVTSIIEFRQRVNSITTKLGGPVIVHCSAGVGRTGTYIALDSLTKEGKDTNSVNIHGFVQKMREQRVNMVQTAEQFQYLHSAVVHSLTFDCAAITAEQFKRHFNNMDDKSMAAKFKQLQSTVEKKSDDEVKAIAVNKKHKDLNRAGADIPGDYRRPKLHINKDTESCSYINAVLVNSFKTKNRFIVAMTPLPGTVLDFLTLLYQENCSCIVSLEAPESLNDKNVGTYYPADNQELKHGVFKVTCTKGVTSDSYVMRKLTITYNKQAESTSKTFNHFQFTKWPRGGHVPSDPATFLQMILDVETKANATADNGPILIHCLNGSARSGLYCAVSILREKMEIEHEVSVVNTVRYIKARRPSAIPNKDQYAFCHQAVVAYLDTFDKDIYSNFSLKL